MNKRSLNDDFSQVSISVAIVGLTGLSMSYRFSCVYCGFRMHHSSAERRFFSFFKHGAKAVATQVAYHSTSLLVTECNMRNNTY